MIGQLQKCWSCQHWTPSRTPDEWSLSGFCDKHIMVTTNLDGCHNYTEMKEEHDLTEFADWCAAG